MESPDWEALGFGSLSGVEPEDFIDVTTERRRAFEAAFRALPWQESPIRQRAVGYYENRVLDTTVYADVRRLTAFGGAGSEPEDEIIIQLGSGEKDWAYSSRDEENTSAEAGAIMTQFIEIMAEDPHAGTAAPWVRDVLEQFHELSRNDWPWHPGIVPDLMSSAFDVAESHTLLVNYNNGTKLEASRRLISPYLKVPKLNDFGSHREFRVLEITANGQFYEYSTEIREQLIILTTEQHLAVSGLTNQLWPRRELLQDELRVARATSRNVASNTKMQELVEVLEQASKSGIAAQKRS